MQYYIVCASPDITILLSALSERRNVCLKENADAETEVIEDTILSISRASTKKVKVVYADGSVRKEKCTVLAVPAYQKNCLEKVLKIACQKYSGTPNQKDLQRLIDNVTFAPVKKSALLLEANPEKGGYKFAPKAEAR